MTHSSLYVLHVYFLIQVTTLAVSADLNLVASGSNSNILMFHSLCAGEFVRAFNLNRHGTNGVKYSVKCIKISSCGLIAIYSEVVNGSQNAIWSPYNGAQLTDGYVMCLIKKTPT